MITDVARVDLRVDDAARAAAFYEEVVGLGDARGRLVGLSDDGVTGRAPRGGAGLFHTAILFPSRADLAAALRRVVAAGLQLTGASDHGVSEALYLEDPAGNGVELYCDRPREVWPEEMYSAPLDLQDLVEAGPLTPAAPPDTRIGHVHLKVSDLDRSVAFYTDVLAFDLMSRWRDEAAFLAVGGYHHHLGLNTWQSRGAPLGPRERPGVERVWFHADDARSVEDPDGIPVATVAA